MHPNPIYRQTDAQQSLAFARTRAFGTLAVSAEGSPLMAHVPFLLSQDADHILMHLVRSNPIARAAREPITARLDVVGPDGYISPDWYGIEDQVPTWNYVAVSFTGTLIPMPVSDLMEVLTAQSAAYEARITGKKPWTMDKLSDETRDRFFRMILPFRMDISDMQSTWKLGQNKADDARLGAAEGLANGFGSELEALAALMRQPPKSA